MGSTGGKYNINDGSSTQNGHTTLPVISTKLNEESLPKCIHQDFFADSFSSNESNSTIVWLDTEIHHHVSNIDIQIKLKNLINYLRVFDKLNVFEHYMKQIIRTRHEKLFLIISPKLALTMIPHLHHLSAIKHIYIYGKEEIDGKIKSELLKRYPKIKGIFSKCRYLIAQITEDQNSNNN